MKQPVVTVVGGSGFVGRYVVKRLAAAGYGVRVLCRHPSDAAYLRVSGNVGQVVLDYADLSKPETLKGKLAGSVAVVNLVGVLFERGRQNFARIQAQGAEKLAQEAKATGVKRFVQLSALGVEDAKLSKYARSKLAGEQAVRAVYPDAVILRPSVIFGAEDNFFNQFARLGRVLPALPAIGGGKTLFQPVFVDDVAAAVLRAVESADCAGNTYELGGPDVFSFKEILRLIANITGHAPVLVPLPFAAASVVGRAASLMPKPFITPDQVRLLRYDNVVKSDAKGFAELGMVPVAVESVVPEMLAYCTKAA